MQVTTLGPLAVDGRPVRGERLRAVVRELVDARGRPVTVAALVEAVWDGDPPEDAVGAVQALVSRVRRLGLPVNGGPGGYTVPADQVTVDAVEASSLVDSARAALRDQDPATARRLADRARALFPDVPELDAPARIRLFASVAEVRADAALAHQAAPGSATPSDGALGVGALQATEGDEADLRRLVELRPPHEPAAARLVRLLAAQGRSAEALDLVARLREELADEYGADLPPAVAEAHLALLRGELHPRRSATTALPPAWRRAVTPLVGRDADVAAVHAALAGAPLVTLVAVGGAGKTRLAAEVARRAAVEGQPVRVIELAGLRDPAELGPALLAVVGAEPTTPPAARAPDRLRTAVAELDGLLVLDNCEHLLDGVAALVAELLSAAPGLTVLATSRAPLGLVGEVAYRLGTLPDADARALLLARAGRDHQARPGGEHAGHLVDELCRRLDNLPLALELAAARLRSMPVADVLAGLADRFALLDDALRGLPDRHASLWAMVDWSYALLAPPERELLARLAVIPAGFTADCAAAVAGRPDVRPGLAALVEQSLLGFDESDDGARYRMLETVREYGEARLGEDGREAARTGLIGWARERAVALADDFIGPSQVTALARAGADQETLVAALRWSLARGDEPAAVDLAAAVFHLWTVRGLHLEVLGWAEPLLHVDDPAARLRSAVLRGKEALQEAGQGAGRPLPNADPLARVLLLVVTNGGVTGLGPHRLSALPRRALRVLVAERGAEITPRPAALIAALRGLESSDPAAHMRVAEELVAHEDALVQGFGMFVRSVARENLGQVDESALDSELAYRRFEAVGDHWVMGLAALAVAQRLAARARPGAGEWLRRSERHLELVGAAGDARSVRVLLDVELALDGDPDAARRLVETAEAHDREPSDRAQARLGLAQLALRQDRLPAVETELHRLVELIADPAFAVAQLRVVARAAAATLFLRLDRPGADERAVALLAPARTEALSIMDTPVIGSCVLATAELAAHRGQNGLARELVALGSRLGADVVYQFQDGPSARLAAALAAPTAKEGPQWTHAPIEAALDRVRVVLDELLS